MVTDHASCDVEAGESLLDSLRLQIEIGRRSRAFGCGCEDIDRGKRLAVIEYWERAGFLGKSWRRRCRHWIREGIVDRKRRRLERNLVDVDGLDDAALAHGAGFAPDPRPTGPSPSPERQTRQQDERDDDDCRQHREARCAGRGSEEKESTRHAQVGSDEVPGYLEGDEY